MKTTKIICDFSFICWFGAFCSFCSLFSILYLLFFKRLFEGVRYAIALTHLCESWIHNITTFLCIQPSINIVVIFPSVGWISNGKMCLTGLFKCFITCQCSEHPSVKHRIPVTYHEGNCYEWALEEHWWKTNPIRRMTTGINLSPKRGRRTAEAADAKCLDWLANQLHLTIINIQGHPEP